MGWISTGSTNPAWVSIRSQRIRKASSPTAGMATGYSSRKRAHSLQAAKAWGLAGSSSKKAIRGNIRRLSASSRTVRQERDRNVAIHCGDDKLYSDNILNFYMRLHYLCQRRLKAEGLRGQLIDLNVHAEAAFPVLDNCGSLILLGPVEQARLDTSEYLRQNQQEFQQKVEQGKLDFELGRMELREFLEERKNERMAERAERRAQRRRELLAKLTDEQREAIEHIEQRIREGATRNKLLRRRLVEAFPNMRSTRYQGALERIKEELFRKKGE